MIYCTPDPNRVPDGVVRIDVDREYEFDREAADLWLDLHRSQDVWIVTPRLFRWFHLPQVGRLLDYMTFRGAEVRHVAVPCVGNRRRTYDYGHDQYYSARLEKLYSSDILDAWRQPTTPGEQ